MTGPRRPPPTPGLNPSEFRAQTNNLLEKANAHLSNQQPQIALKIYTTILTKVAPAHPIAFLNRALAYLELNFPELAVSDAHKAKIATQDIRDRYYGSLRSLGLQSLISYCRVCEQAADSGTEWATEPTCYLRGAEMDVEPASIVLDVSGLRKVDKYEKTNALLWELETKANYRIALGLWKVGGGARMDALNLLSTARLLVDDLSEDREAFDDLGNSILEDMSMEFYTENRLAQDKGLKNKEEKDAFQMAGTRGENTHRQTLIKRKLYPDNTFELDVERKGIVIPKDLIDSINNITTNAQLKIINSPTGQPSHLVLVATRDIYPGELVLEERSSLYVTTTSLDSDSHLYCDACATKLLTSLSHIRRTNVPTPLPRRNYESDESPPGKNTSVASSMRTDEISDPHDPLITSFLQQEPSPTISPPSSHTLSAKDPSPPTTTAKPNPPDHPHLCPQCRQALYCSQDCLKTATNTYHPVICGSSISDTILFQTLQHSNQKRNTPGIRDSKGWSKPEEQCLRILLLSRILAIAVKTGRHPLDLEEVRFLNAGEMEKSVIAGDGKSNSNSNSNLDEDMDMDTSSPTSSSSNNPPTTSSSPNHTPSPNPPPHHTPSTTNKTTWSYLTHIHLPFTILTSLHASPLKDLFRFDAWVINTLLAKIEMSMRVTSTTRCVKIFENENGKKGRGDKRRGLSMSKKCEGEDEKEEREKVWIASLHPFLPLLFKTPSPETDETTSNPLKKANVQIKESGKGGIRVFAIENSNSNLDLGIGFVNREEGGNEDGFVNTQEEESAANEGYYADDEMMDTTSDNNPKEEIRNKQRPAIKKGEVIILKEEGDEGEGDVGVTVLRNEGEGGGGGLNGGMNGGGSGESGGGGGVRDWLEGVMC
ncbi:MAG: hypothetical protein M1812_007435 [Candelaria pacifica]|nr:MAG: hypothetical protein M1812_007435 [Candelaria pacifica]